VNRGDPSPRPGRRRRPGATAAAVGGGGAAACAAAGGGGASAAGGGAAAACRPRAAADDPRRRRLPPMERLQGKAFAPLGSHRLGPHRLPPPVDESGWRYLRRDGDERREEWHMARLEIKPFERKNRNKHKQDLVLATETQH